MAKKCLEEGCENPRFSKGWCKFHQYKRTDNKKNKRHIRPISQKREEEYKIYRPKRDKYMSEHEICEVKGCHKLANDLHHKNGRNGKRLYDDNYFMAICRPHHIKIDEDPKWARSNGYLI